MIPRLGMDTTLILLALGITELAEISEPIRMEMNSTTVEVIIEAECEQADVSQTIMPQVILLLHEEIIHEPINDMDNISSNTWTTTGMQITIMVFLVMKIVMGILSVMKMIKISVMLLLPYLDQLQNSTS